MAAMLAEHGMMSGLQTLEPGVERKHFKKFLILNFFYINSLIPAGLQFEVIATKIR
jgi:hypothetical protein